VYRRRLTATAVARGYPLPVMNDRRGGRVAQAAARLLGGALVAGALLACTPAVPTATPTAAVTPAPTAAATALASEPIETEAALETPEETNVGAPLCALADLKASHGIVEGAAGSTLTEVVLVSAETCSVDAFPALGLRDASGDPLIGAPSSGPGATDLVAGVAYRSEVRLANWCAPEPEFPLSLVVIINDDELEVTGDSFPEEGDLPPCNGEVGPTLEGTAWAATP
jgi:hypothetical protein